MRQGWYQFVGTNMLELTEYKYQRVHHNWDDRFLLLAEMVAGWSKDPSTKVGCVIVEGKKRPVLGFNGFPQGINDNDRLEDYQTKHKLIIHAEQNAMDNANRSLKGNTLYVTYPSCVRCCVSIVSRGIGRVVCLESSPEKMLKHRADTELAMELFTEANVRFDILRRLEDDDT